MDSSFFEGGALHLELDIKIFCPNLDGVDRYRQTLGLGKAYSVGRMLPSLQHIHGMTHVMYMQVIRVFSN
jgi:hypothetical protein